MKTFLDQFSISKTKKLSSPLNTNIAISNFIGMWPKDDHFTTGYLLYALLLILTLSGLHTALQIINFYFIYTDMTMLSHSMYVVLSDAVSLVKSYVFITKIKSVKNVIKMLDSEIFAPKTEEQVEGMQKRINVWIAISWIFIITGTFTCILWALYPVVDGSSKEGGLPFISWYPFDPTVSPLYQLTYCYQLLAIFFIAYANLMGDTIMAAIMMYAAGQCFLLKNNLINIYEMTEKRLRDNGENIDENKVNSELNNTLLDNIRHHKQILKYVRIGNDFIDPSAIFQFATSVLALCLTTFQLTLLHPLTSEFYSVISYQAAIFTQVLMYCYFGNEVMLESADIPYAIFQSSWVDAPLNFKKNMLFFMRATRAPIKFTALRFFTLSLETFTKIVRSSWSYFALLRQRNKKQLTME